jgi:hypothetical protein
VNWTNKVDWRTYFGAYQQYIPPQSQPAAGIREERINRAFSARKVDYTKLYIYLQPPLYLEERAILTLNPTSNSDIHYKHYYHDV